MAIDFLQYLFQATNQLKKKLFYRHGDDQRINGTTKSFDKTIIKIDGNFEYGSLQQYEYL